VDDDGAGIWVKVDFKSGRGNFTGGIQLVVFVCGFCTNSGVVGLFIEDGLLDWNGFPGYKRKVVRRGGGFFIKMGFWEWKGPHTMT